MTPNDYENVYKLWTGIKGFGIRAVDDSKQSIIRFLQRNPDTSVVAEEDGRIIGSILSGHDGRRGNFYHVCVAKEDRAKGVGREMVLEAVKRLEKEGICKVGLVAFQSNQVGNQFWKDMGFTFREDLNYYDFSLDEENRTTFIK